MVAKPKDTPTRRRKSMTPRIPSRSMPLPKCHLCDMEIESQILYKSHLVVHYYSPLENAIKDIFKSDEGICKQCNDPGGKPMELNEFIKHWAVDHDNILNVISSEVKTHFNLVFPDSTNSE